MGKTTGFLEYARKENVTIPPEERIRNFDEFHIPMDEEERRKQGARCMNCGVPMCQSGISLGGKVTGCPLHNLIPEWNDEIYHGNIGHALSRLLKKNNFPEFTGRVCPALCEKACIEGRDGDSVTSHDNELFIIESAYKMGLMKPRIPEVRSGKKVAVVGSGPAGLAAADRLNHRGHSVTVFERDDEIGGLLMYGIPNMKLDKKVIRRRRELMEEEGVSFVTSYDVNSKKKAEKLINEYDAVILCCGAKKARSLNVEGIDSDGIYPAVSFLKSATEDLIAGRDFRINAKDKDVVIVGGGDTGNDCTGTCIRQGARSVTQIEMMPRPPKERTKDNPWPMWPNVEKVDYGQEEAIAVFGRDPRVYGTTVDSIISENGSIKKVNTVKVHFDADRKMIKEEGTEKTIPCDLLIIAAGFTGCEDYTAKIFSTELSDRHTVVTDQAYKTNNHKVFSAGDMRRGQSLVVWAIDEGRKCARSVDEFLMGYTNME
jgi:glutamate synthase (NADPH/NADH) small chain